MIGSFWNLCRACPAMPIDKVRVCVWVRYIYIYVYVSAYIPSHPRDIDYSIKVRLLDYYHHHSVRIINVRIYVIKCNIISFYDVVAGSIIRSGSGVSSNTHSSIV